MPMKFRDCLIQFRDRAGLNKSELAKKISVSPGYIMNLETGRQRPPTLSRVKLISGALRLSPQDEGLLLRLAADERLPTEEKDILKDRVDKRTPLRESPIQRIPVISWVHANKFEKIHDPFPAGVADEYTYTEVKGKNIFALRIANDCMYPKFNEGDIIVINPHERVDPGDYVVVADREEGKATFKQLKKYGNKFYLHPLNPKYGDIEMDHKKQYTIIGKAIERLAREKL